VATEDGNRFTLPLQQEQLAEMILTSGDIPGAYQLYSEIFDLYREQGDIWSESRVLSMLGKLLCVQGECDQAEKLYLDALLGIAMVKSKAALELPAIELVCFILQNPIATSQAKTGAQQLYQALETRLSWEHIEQIKVETLDRTVDQIAGLLMK
jgi:hypothetical protein